MDNDLLVTQRVPVTPSHNNKLFHLFFINFQEYISGMHTSFTHTPEDMKHEDLAGFLNHSRPTVLPRVTSSSPGHVVSAMTLGFY